MFPYCPLSWEDTCHLRTVWPFPKSVRSSQVLLYRQIIHSNASGIVHPLLSQFNPGEKKICIKENS